MVDIYRDAGPKGDSCFSIYQIRWIKKNASSIFPSKTFAKRRIIFLSVRKTVNIQGYSEVTGANQNARKLLSIDLVNTKYIWSDTARPGLPVSFPQINFAKVQASARKFSLAEITFC